MTLDTMLLAGAGVLLAALGAARLSSSVGLPSLLLFLFLGVGVGLWVEFDDAALAHDLGFSALVLILGEGGFTTKWREMRPILSLAGLLATVGIGVSIVAMTLFGHLVLGLDLATALLLGAVTAPTDSAAVFSVLRRVPIPARLRAILEAESGLNDAPVVLLVSAATAWALGESTESPPLILGMVLVELAGGLLLGLAIGWLGARVLKRIALPASGLYPLGAMGWALLAYGAGAYLHVSGFAAVYICAVVLGNSDLPHRNATKSFAEGVGRVAQIGLFGKLGLRPPPAAIPIDPAKPNACNKLADVKLAATIDKATNTLKVSGTANAPVAGFATALQAGPLDKMNPPTQIVLLRANAPDGATPQVVTPVTLSLDIPNAQPAYKAVRVACPGVPDVELTVG